MVLESDSVSSAKEKKLQTLNFLVWKVPSHSPTPLKLVKPVKEKQIVHIDTDITFQVLKLTIR